MSIHFRRSYLARSLYLPPDPAPEIEFDNIGRLAVSVRLKNIAREARPFWVWEPSVRCTGSVHVKVPKKTQALFEALATGTIPDGMSGDDFFQERGIHKQDQDPVFQRGRIPAFLDDALTPLQVELENVVNMVIGLVRWRCNVSGPVDVPPLGPLEWSLDGAAWKLDVRRPAILSASHGPDAFVTEARRFDLDELIRAGAREPLHQSLLREAESLRESNPRSALTIGISAAETAVKFLVGHLSPDASWLVQNLQSPPIVKMLEQYVPKLLGPTSMAFPTTLLKGMTVAVLWRNELVHGARAAVNESEMASAFANIRDVVWLCDYFAGAKWGVNRVRKETLASMGISPTVDNSGWFVD